MRIGYMYDLRVYPPRGGNHVHALEVGRGFLGAGHELAVVDDPTMPGAISYSGSAGQLEKFIASLDVLYIRVDARFLSEWHAAQYCMSLAATRCPIVWEINAPASEALAYSWLGGRNLAGEGRLRRARRKLHAARQAPAIWREERFRQELAKQVDATICVSTSLADYSRSALHVERCLVLPNGGHALSEEEIVMRRAKRRDSRFTVFYSGSAMFPWQGLDYLAEVVRKAAVVAPDVRFLLAVNQRTADLPALSNVDIVANLDREALTDAMCQADVCVSLHPEYPWSPYGFHNSPMKLFEYMSCQVPVVASDHGQMGELFSDGHDLLLTVNTPEAILRRLLFVRDNPCLAATIARNGWQRIRSELNWQSNVDKTLQLFSSLTVRERAACRELA